MIRLTSVIHNPDNSVEATWVNVIAQAIEVPESTAPDTLGKDGEVIPGEVIPAHTIPAVEVPIRCHSYADVQIQMLRDHAAGYGTPLTDYEDLIARVESNIVPYVAPVPAKTVCLLRIDADTDAIYGSVLGNRSEEYTGAATDAQDYKTAGYTGTVPAGVQSWATATGWTARQSADDILATAAQWTEAQANIRAQRLLRKVQIRAATDSVDITAAMSEWAGFVAYMRGQLGIAS